MRRINKSAKLTLIIYLSSDLELEVLNPIYIETKIAKLWIRNDPNLIFLELFGYSFYPT